MERIVKCNSSPHKIVNFLHNTRANSDSNRVLANSSKSPSKFKLPDYNNNFDITFGTAAAPFCETPENCSTKTSPPISDQKSIACLKQTEPQNFTECLLKHGLLNTVLRCEACRNENYDLKLETCKACLRKACKLCIILCSSCSNKICKNCSSECDECEIKFCFPKCGFQCTRCKKPKCKKCLEKRNIKIGESFLCSKCLEFIIDRKIDEIWKVNEKSEKNMSFIRNEINGNCFDFYGKYIDTILSNQ